jgi:hypothetical protein
MKTSFIGYAALAMAGYFTLSIRGVDYAVASDPPPATDAKEFMPLIKGSKWVYKKTGTHVTPATLTRTCEDMEIVGKSYFGIKSIWSVANRGALEPFEQR